MYSMDYQATQRKTWKYSKNTFNSIAWITEGISINSSTALFSIAFSFLLFLLEIMSNVTRHIAIDHEKYVVKWKWICIRKEKKIKSQNMNANDKSCDKKKCNNHSFFYYAWIQILLSNIFYAWIILKNLKTIFSFVRFLLFVQQKSLS